MFGLDEIGQEARSRRKALGLTQKEAADKSCIHRNEVIKIEKGAFSGSVLTVASYLQTLGMELKAGIRSRPKFEDIDQYQGGDDA